MHTQFVFDMMVFGVRALLLAQNILLRAANKERKNKICCSLVASLLHSLIIPFIRFEFQMYFQVLRALANDHGVHLRRLWWKMHFMHSTKKIDTTILKLLVVCHGRAINLMSNIFQFSHFCIVNLNEYILELGEHWAYEHSGPIFLTFACPHCSQEVRATVHNIWALEVHFGGSKGSFTTVPSSGQCPTGSIQFIAGRNCEQYLESIETYF